MWLLAMEVANWISGTTYIDKMAQSCWIQTLFAVFEDQLFTGVRVDGTFPFCTAAGASSLKPV